MKTSDQIWRDRGAWLFATALVFAHSTQSFGQTASLSLSSGIAQAGGSANLSLSLLTPSGNQQPAGLQWTFSYSATDLASLDVQAGEALTSQGKSLVCNSSTGSTICLAYGLNSTTISSGAIAVVSIRLADPQASVINGQQAIKLVCPISVPDAIAVLADGSGMPISSTGGSVLIQGMEQTSSSPSITSLAPSYAIQKAPSFTLIVYGSGFVNGAQVNWNGSPRTTTYRSADQVTASIPAIDVAVAGAAQITVSNPGGATSSALTLPIMSSEPVQSLSPLPVSVNPPAGSGDATFVFAFQDVRGWQDLEVVNILINDSLDARKACYLAYSRPLNALYLVRDDGWTIRPGAFLNVSGSTSNGQCSVAWDNSPVSGDGYNMFLTLSIGFKNAFAGNKIVYMAAQDAVRTNSGWRPLGVWQIPGAPASTTTTAVEMNPSRGSGMSQTVFTFRFSDVLGHSDLGVGNILVNSSLDGRHACYLAFDNKSNTLYLVNDAGDGLLQGRDLGTGGSIGNAQCTVAWDTGAIVARGNDKALSLAISFSPQFTGSRIFYMAVRDRNEANNTGWQPTGTWSIE